MSEILKKLYYDPKYGLQGKAKFVEKVKRDYPNITNKEINTFFENQTLSKVNKKVKFKGFYKIVAIPRTFQCDLFFMPSYKSRNDNISVFFIAIDIMSRKMWIYPMKNKTKNEIMKCINKLYKDIPDLKGIEADDEFNQTTISEWCNEKNILLSTDVSSEDHFNKGNKLGIVDSAVRNIKKMIRNYMLVNETTRYIDQLDDFVENYNSSVHTSLDKRTPDEAFEDIAFQQHMFDKLTAYNENLDDKIDINIGDYVLIARDKKKFDKENTTFLPDIHVVYDKIGRKYVIIDADGKELKRKYKYFELQTVDPNTLEKRLNEKEMNEVKKLHSNVKKIQKELDKSYNEVINDIEENKKITKRVTRSGRIS